MTSMFEQYNTTLKREENLSSQVVSSNTLTTSSGYVSVRTKEETPIFSKQKMKINLPHDILFMRICNNWLVTLMSHQVLLRLYFLQPDRQDEVFLEKYLNGLRVSNMFLDPLGNHLLIALSTKVAGLPPELLYLHRRSNKPKKIERFRDHEITAVAFNPNNQSDVTTGSILIGTSKGLIFETEFGIDGEKMIQSNWKQIFDIGKGEHCPITGIEFHKVPMTSRHIILVSTLNRLYKFHEELRVEEKPPYLQHIFNSYLNVPEDVRDFHEIPNKLKYSKLRFNYDRSTKFPKCFGWLTDAGIYSGEIDQRAETPQFVTTEEIIPFPMQADVTPAAAETASYIKAKKPVYPISFVLTDFHVLLAYTDHVTAVSMLNYQTIYEEFFPDQLGKLVDITTDSISGTIYACSARNIFRFKVTHERRNVWAMYLEKNEFELAKLYSVDNPAHLDIVMVKQAELFFSKKEYLKSAETYAETQTSFEDICLKFMAINEYDALLLFLQNRLATLKPQDKTQITMLVVWIVELYLTQMARWSNSDQHHKSRVLQEKFDAFMKLPRVIDCMRNNRTVIYDLMASHGDNFNLSSLTTVNKDFESVINQYIVQGKYMDALSVLRNQNRTDLFYKYCPMLIEAIPKETINAIMAQGKRLDPIGLLPTFVCLETDQHRSEVMRYLEFCIHSLGCVEQSIHNFLVQLYAQQKSGDKLTTYLETQGKDITLVHYDVHYALRVCGEHNLTEACVFLQCLLELWHPAVELALTFDTTLAQKTASQPMDRDLRRKLWLLIAEHEIKDKNDVTQALELLKECDLLRIEDLLPFFDDFQKIDHFKQAICDALKEYNEKIQQQRKDMDESAKSAERVRNELQSFRNHSVVIDGQQKCAVCDVYLLVKPFFVFPCGHKFHNDCLEHRITEHLSLEDTRRLSQLKHKLQSINTSTFAVPNSQQVDLGAMNGILETRDQIKNEIETILAADCLFCGEYMIQNIDKPFIEDWERVKMDWQ